MRMKPWNPGLPRHKTEPRDQVLSVNELEQDVQLILTGISILSLITLMISSIRRYILLKEVVIDPVAILVVTVVNFVLLYLSHKKNNAWLSNYIIWGSGTLAVISHVFWGSRVIITPLLYILSITSMLFFYSAQKVKHSLLLVLLLYITSELTWFLLIQTQVTPSFFTTGVELLIHSCLLLLCALVIIRLKQTIEQKLKLSYEQHESAHENLQSKYRTEYLYLQQYVSLGKITLSLLHDLANVLQHGLFGVALNNPKDTEVCLKKVAKMVQHTRFKVVGEPVRKRFCFSTELRELLDFYTSSFQSQRVRAELITDNPRYLMGDPMLFQQCVGNFILNAFEAIVKNPKDKKRMITIYTINTWRHTTITIRDTGSGISRELREKIFQPFVSSNQISDKPRGIGLSMAKEFLEKEFGAEILLRSTGNTGTQFEIRFPRKKGGMRASKYSTRPR